MVLLFVQTPAAAQGIFVEAASSASSSSSVSSLAWSHTVGTGTHRLLVVGVSVSVAAATVSSITYGSAGLTKAGSQATASNVSEIWYLVAPASGTDTITVNLAGFARVVGGAISLTGVNQTTPLGTYVSDTATSSTPSVAVTSAEGEAVFDCLAVPGNAGSATVGTGQTERWNISTGNGASHVIGAASTEPGASSVTMSWTLDSSRTWALGAVPIKPAIATLARLQEFTATRGPAGSELRWRTAFERDHLGFHLYRQANGTLARVNDRLIPGSALLARGSVPFRAGRSYRYVDPIPGEAYWLEGVSLAGSRTRHGPFTPVSRVPEREDAAPALFPITPPLGADALPTPSARRAVTPEWTPESARRHRLATAGPAIKLLVREEGLIRVTARDLREAGWTSVDPRRLRLVAEGRDIPLRIQPGRTGRFEGDAYLEFYGVGLETPASDTRAYWLTRGPSTRTPALRTAPFGAVENLTRDSLEVRERSLLVLPIMNGDRENFFGPVLFQDTTPVDVRLGTPSTLPEAVARLEVAIQGASESRPIPQPHQIEVRVNGVLVGEIRLVNREYRAETLGFRQNLLAAGLNRISLTPTGGEADISLLDSIRLTYWRESVARGDRLRVDTPAGRSIRLRGFTGPDVRVLDVTDADRPLELMGRSEGGAGAFSVVVAVPGRPGTRRLLYACRSTAASAPAAIVQPRAPRLQVGRPGGLDLAIVTHASLQEPLGPLVALRRSQGLRVAVVDVEQVYDAFSFGEKDPAAIRRFLKGARAAGRPAARHALLVGNGTYDPRNYLALGEPDFIPIHLVSTAFLETASDDWYADFDDDGLAEMAVGRLPVRSPEELRRIVEVLVRREQPGGKDGTRRLVLVADHDPAAGFDAALDRVRGLTGSLPVAEVHRGALGDLAARDLLHQEWRSGPRLVHYYGHGSEDSWAGGLLSAADVFASDRPPVVTAMTCSNGLFFDPRRPCLASALLTSNSAAAVWASSGLTAADGQEQLAAEFIRNLLMPGKTLGDAVLAAKRRVRDPDVRRTWILFGDPASRP